METTITGMTRRTALQLLGSTIAVPTLIRNANDGSRGVPLETYMRSRRIRPSHLAYQCGYSRQHMLRIRMGRMMPTPECAARIVVALCSITGETVRVVFTDVQK